MKYNLLFSLKEESLRGRVRWGGQECAFLVGYRIDKSKWVSSAQRCKNNTTHGKKKVPASVINMRLNEIENAIKVLFEREECPTRDQIRSAIGKPVKKQIDGDVFSDLYETYIEEQISVAGWVQNTYKKHYVYRNHIMRINPDLKVSEVDDNFLNSIIRKLVSQGMENTSIKKMLSDMRWFFRWLKNKGYDLPDSALAFKLRLKETPKPIIYLTWEELMKVWEYNPPKPYLERTKDLFMFGCFTSLRYSDMINLKRTDINNDCISIVTQKTREAISIDLNKYSRAILEKYKDEEKPIPTISIQKYNDYLKELMELCEINTPIKVVRMSGNYTTTEVVPKYQLISSHAARRTFISNAIILGIPVGVVMKWTGHTDYRMMRPYIGIADEARKSAMKMFDQ